MPKEVPKLVQKRSTQANSQDSHFFLHQIANCLGYIVVHATPEGGKDQDKDKPEKVVTLHYLGFSREQTAPIFQSAVNAVNLHLFKQGITKRSRG